MVSLHGMAARSKLRHYSGNAKHNCLEMRSMVRWGRGISFSAGASGQCFRRGVRAALPPEILRTAQYL